MKGDGARGGVDGYGDEAGVESAGAPGQLIGGKAGVVDVGIQDEGLVLPADGDADGG